MKATRLCFREAEWMMEFSSSMIIHTSARVGPEIARQAQLVAFVIALVASLKLSPVFLAASEPQDMVFVSDQDRSQQRYVLVTPEKFDPTQPISVLIALHGHGADRWQFVLDERDECRATRDAAKRFGMILVAPDYRAKTSWMGPAAEADMLQIINLLKKEYRIKKLIICGGSMGGTGALTFAALHPELVDGVVAMNGTANLVDYEGFQDAIAQSFGGSKIAKPEEYRKRSAELNGERLAMPIAMTTGGRDTIVSPESAIRLADYLAKQKSPVLLIHKVDGGHETNYEDAKRAFDFVLEKLK
jgi:predicted esterase